MSFVLPYNFRCLSLDVGFEIYDTLKHIRPKILLVARIWEAFLLGEFLPFVLH